MIRNFNISQEVLRWHVIKKFFKNGIQKILNSFRQNWVKRVCHWPPVSVDVRIRWLL